MKNLILFTGLFIFNLLPSYAQQPDLTTYFEHSGGKRTPRYQETIEYCKSLDNASPLISYQTFGVSPQGRDLPLLIIDQQGNSSAQAVKKSGNIVLMIQACIHPGESDGKDAGFLLIRDLITRPELSKLLDHVTLLFIPVINVDGHERFGPYNRINQNGPEEMGWRTTAQNLNLNRDFMKADAPEMQAWLALFNEWLPDFFVDCHATDGADYQYVITYALETLGTMESGLSDWTAGTCEPFLTQEMAKAGMPIFPYVQFRRWHDPRSGLINKAAPPMLSQGYAAVQNRPGLLIESHMLKPYDVRVRANAELFKIVMQLLNREHQQLRKLVESADRITASPGFRAGEYPVSWTESLSDSVMVDFAGFDYTIDTSDLSGGLWFRYDNTRPVTWKLPMFIHSAVDQKVKLPEAYVIPPEWGELIRRLKLHGVQMHTIQKEMKVKASVYRFRNVKWQSRSYEGRIKASYLVEDSIQMMIIPAGSVIVDMNQRTARVIAHLLEPTSPDSYASWGFFNAIFEQKEYFESYVMEKEARKMLAKDPLLKAEFEKKRASDPDFSQDSYAILGWFYSKTPWMDSRFNVYPVGRILDRKTVDQLLVQISSKTY